jgi:uncharacterized protein (DUF302 family)
VTTKQIAVQRLSVITSKSFEDVVARLEAAVGHPNMDAFRKDVASARTYAELEKVIHAATGASGFMEFGRFDFGEIVRKDRGKEAPRSLRLLIGNPLIMKQMVESAPDAGSYAPVTILIDERSDGVHLSYDSMVSLLASYGRAGALRVAQDLDSEVRTLLVAVAN